MGRSSSLAPRLPFSITTAIVLISAARAVNAGFWSISIDESPAPAPEDGPPFSAHASRNKALVPYQIIGIVGAYIGFVLILFSFLLTFGRKLRQQAQSGLGSKSMKMVRPANRTFDPSPTSPISSRSWYSPRRLGRKTSAPNSPRGRISSPTSPGMDSVVSFDTNVIEADRQKRQEEMERLYAAVIAQEDRKSGATASQTDMEPHQPPPEYSRPTPAKREPLRLLTNAPQLQHLQANRSNSVSPRTSLTPKSPIRAIYPPTSPIRAGYPPMMAATPTSFNHPQSLIQATRESRTSSFGSIGSAGSGQSGPKKLKKSIRNLRISSPMPQDNNSDGARTPLSPRFYMDPDIPPEPPTARTLDSRYAPTTPGSLTSWRRGDDDYGDDDYGDDDYGSDGDGEKFDKVRDLPRPNPQRMSSYQYDYQPEAITNATSFHADPTHTLRTFPVKKPPPQHPVVSVNNTLPFRQYQNNIYPSQFRPLPSPNMQTTYLEARKNRLGAPLTGNATPYSPYMPFTPLTPVTPHLTSRRERKQREKEEKQVHGTITEEDAVADESELWSSGY